jgi:hypothetical protein
MLPDVGDGVCVPDVGDGDGDVFGFFLLLLFFLVFLLFWGTIFS